MENDVTAIVWFRNDLRLSDNPTLAAADNDRVVPLYIWSPEDEGAWPRGGASRWWLHHSLLSLDASLRQLGLRLIVRRGPAVEVISAIIEETGASRLLCSRRYEPAAREVEAAVAAALQRLGVSFDLHCSSLLFEPWEIATAEQKPYRIFTQFWRACLDAPQPPRPIPAPTALRPPDTWPNSLSLEDLGLLPRVDWAAGLRETWEPGEAGARARLHAFVRDAINRYSTGRDRPDLFDTSRLSPHLHFGEISVREVWHACKGCSTYASQLGWREFAHHLLWHFPHTTTQPMQEHFRNFPWTEDRNAFRRWAKGKTGYPFVDAGMRELWHTGWMHNRTRMVVASFLVKDLLIPWQEGARWFWDTLVDADLANNTLGWQWAAGCGADAAPYFRIFNPVLQGKKFDPEGEYVRRWVPELRTIGSSRIHEPHRSLDETHTGYPAPMVDHAMARQRALSAFEELRRPRTDL